MGAAIRERHQQAFELNLRTIGIVDLASLAGTDAFEGSLDDAPEALLDQLLDPDYRVHASIEPVRQAAKEAEADTLEILGELLASRDLLGLAVQFSTPVMTKMGRRHWSYSWGYTQSIWVYAETYEQAWNQGLEWAAQSKAVAKPAPRRRSVKSRATQDAGGAQ
jgi:hypothetical protein